MVARFSTTYLEEELIFLAKLKSLFQDDGYVFQTSNCSVQLVDELRA